MAPTSDERREVAARLRRLHLGGGNKDLIELTLSDAVGAWHENGMSWDYITERLADLIDPTCRFLPTFNGGFGCDGCYTWFQSMETKPNYCPSCGARVVSDDD